MRGKIVCGVERLLKFTTNPNDPGVYRYVLKPEMYSTLTQAKVIKEAAMRSKAVENVNENGGNTNQGGNQPSNGGGNGGNCNGTWSYKLHGSVSTKRAPAV